MTISTAQVQERLAKLIDPVAGIDYVSGKMLKGVETDDAGGVTVKIELGYPARFCGTEREGHCGGGSEGAWN